MEPTVEDAAEIMSEATTQASLTGVSANLRRTTIGSATAYRDDCRTEYEEVLCSSDIQREAGDARGYRVHPLVRLCTSSAGWAETVDICCFHCCETFEGQTVRIPQSVDPQGVFMVRPTVFCSLPCAKAHLVERNAFDCSVQLLLLHRVARDVYGWTSQNIPTAPPRLCLRRFGGPLDIADFRVAGEMTGMRVIEPPFVPLRLMIESSGGAAPVVAHMPRSEGADMQDNSESDEDGGVNGDTGAAVSGRNAIPAWSVRGLRRPDQPRCLPRAEPATGPSLLESFVTSLTLGQEWDPDLHRSTGVVTSKIPSVADVNRAMNTTLGTDPQRRTLPTVAVTEPKRRQSRRAKRHQKRMPSNTETNGATLMDFTDAQVSDEEVSEEPSTSPESGTS